MRNSCLLLVLALPFTAGVRAESVRIADLVLEQLTPPFIGYVDGIDYTVVNWSAPGVTTAPLTAVDLELGPGNGNTSGCEAADFTGFPAGDVALIQRGACSFRQKVENAEAAGASGVLIFNSGVNGSFQGLTGSTLTGDYQGTMPALFTTYAVGEALAALADPVIRLENNVFRGPAQEAYLRYCLANRDQCSLSVKHVTDGWERHLSADRPQTTASTFKILALMAYAKAVVAGTLDPTETIPRDEWAAFSVRLDGGALQNVFDRLGGPTTITVDQMMRAMMRESDNAAPDWLLNRLGQAAYADVVTDFVDGLHDVPTSINAQIASFFGLPDEAGIAARLLLDYTGHADPGFQDELSDRFFVDMQMPAYVRAIREFYCFFLPWEPGIGPCASSVISTRDELRELLGRYFTRSTSRTYLRMAEALLAENLLPAPEAEVFARHMEYRMEFENVEALFSRYGAKGGSFSPQNVCNWVAYHEDRATGAQTVVTTMIQDSLHMCGQGIRPFDFAEAFALDAAFRERVARAAGFDNRLFGDSFETLPPLPEPARKSLVRREAPSAKWSGVVVDAPPESAPALAER